MFLSSCSRPRNKAFHTYAVQCGMLECDSLVRTDGDLATEAEETIVFLVAVAIDKVEVGVDLVVDQSLVEEATLW